MEFYGFIRNLEKVKLTAIVFIALLSIQVCAQLSLTPQEIGGSPADQISEAISTYKRIEEIDFSDFSKLDRFERVAYIFKNKEALADSYLILSVSTLNDKHLPPGHPNFYTKSKTYVIEEKNGIKSWNRNELGLIQTESSTIIIQRSAQGDSLVYQTMRDILRGGVGSPVKDNISIFCAKDDLSLKTGIEQVFYDVLSLTKGVD